jgi:hypothetical protein
LTEKLKCYTLRTDSYLNDNIEEIKNLSAENIQKKEWIIVIGSKYKQGKIEPPKDDKKVAESIKNAIKQKNKKVRIMSDREIYFSNERKENLIVVGGTSINKITSYLNEKLPIQYVEMKDYTDEKNHDYLVYRTKDSLARLPRHCQSSSEEQEYGSIQIMINPYNESKIEPSYIIVIFGLRSPGTEKAGRKFIKLWENNFEAELEDETAVLQTPLVFGDSTKMLTRKK